MFGPSKGALSWFCHGSRRTACYAAVGDGSNGEYADNIGPLTPPEEDARPPRL